MANVSRINGFRPVKHLNGSPYNGQANLYYVSSASDEILVGDPVKLAGSADAYGNPSVDLSGTTDVACGIVVGIMPSKFDPRGNMTTGAQSLDLPGSAQIAVSGSGYVMVADSPDIVFEVETSNGDVAAANIGLNVTPALGARSATTITSPATVDMGTEATTSTLMFKLLGLSQKVNNSIATSAKVLVMFNAHQFGSVGTTGL